MTDTTQTDTGATSESSAAQTSSPAETPAKGGAGKAATTDQKSATTADKGGAGEAPAEWYAGLPDDLKGEKSILRHATLEDAIRAGIGAEKRLGVPADQLVRLPTKPEDYAEVYRKLGAPETPEGYGIGLPEKATAEDKALADRFGKAMFEAGPFPPQFVKAAVDFINGETLSGMEAEATAAAERQAAGEAQLQKALGAKYDPELALVGVLLNKMDGEIAKAFNEEPGGLKAELDLTQKGNSPHIMMMLQLLSERLGESQKIDGGNSGTGAQGGLTPGQARAARLNLENDPVKGVALMDKSHSMHQSVLTERKRLVRLENGMDPDGD